MITWWLIYSLFHLSHNVERRGKPEHPQVLLNELCGKETKGRGLLGIKAIHS